MGGKGLSQREGVGCAVNAGREKLGGSGGEEEAFWRGSAYYWGGSQEKLRGGEGSGEVSS